MNREELEGQFISYGLKPITATKYCDDLKRIENIVGCNIENFSTREYDKLMSMFAREYIPKVFWREPSVPERYSPNTIRNYLFALKAFFKVTEQDEKMKMIRRIPRTHAKKIKPIIEETEEFLEKIIEYAPKNSVSPFILARNKFMVVFSYFFATRRSELPGLKLTDVQKTKNNVAVEDIKGGGDTYDEPMSSEMFWECYDEYMEHRKRIQSVYLFPTMSGGRMSIEAIKICFRMFDKVLKQSGITENKMCAHLMRRSRITKIAGRTSTRQGMYISRHKSVGAYEKYVDLNITNEMKKQMLDDKTLEV